MSNRLDTSSGDNPAFLLRWRGRQEGPYTAEALEAKLASNQVGLLHEVLHNGRWVTLREYFAEREAVLRAERQAREEKERRNREEAERQAKEGEEQRRAELLAEERRKNDLLQASMAAQQSGQSLRSDQPSTRKPHRGGTILALGIIGLFFGPLSIAAWIMGDSDLREMDARIMDDSGRSSTSAGKSLGVLGTVLWIIAVIIIFTL